MMTKQIADFASLCEAWSRFLMNRYEIDIDADAVGTLLTRLDGGTHNDYECVMRYIGSRERDEKTTHAGNIRRLAADHAERMDDIEIKAKQDRRALQDSRSHANSQLRLALMQCYTELERGAAYASMDNTLEELRMQMASVDDAERRQKADERQRHFWAIEAEDMRHGKVLYGWRMWRDATDRMFALGLVLPEEEGGES